MNILVTGAYGFIGRNLVAQLQQKESYQVFSIGRHAPWSTLSAALAEAELNRRVTPLQFWSIVITPIPKSFEWKNHTVIQSPLNLFVSTNFRPAYIEVSLPVDGPW